MSESRGRSLIMFSKELSGKSKPLHKRAVRNLEGYVRHNGLWQPKKASDDTFDLFYSGKIYLYEQYAQAAGIVFQPEVVRVSVNTKEKQEIERMGFCVQSLTF